MTAAAVARAETKVLDDFNTYPADQAIATSATSTPWLRFGAAVEDNLVASATPVVDGSAGASIPIGFADGRFAVVARNYTKDHPLDLSGYQAIKIDAKSGKGLETTGAKLFLTDGKTSYASKVAVKLSGKGQTLTFSLAARELELTDGSEPSAKVLSKASAVGVQLENLSKTDKPADEVEIDQLVATSTNVGTVPVK